MIVPSLRGFAFVLVVAAVVALVACGNSNKISVCPLAGGCCGPSLTTACRAPQYLYADGLAGEVSGFPVTNGGALGTPVTVSGPQASLGMAAISNAFLYASNPLSMTTGLIDGWSINVSDGSLTSMSG